MASRQYTAAELLQLRGSEDSRAFLGKIKLNPDLADVVKQRPVAIQPRRLKKSKEETTATSSSTDSEEHVVFQGKKQIRPAIGNFDGEAEWKYRGRIGPERNSNEPIAAPTGLDAQQNEGFQKFFKAVISPTHVRVTAGGRIVPNTRNTSPIAKWDKERTALDSDNGDSTKQSSTETPAAGEDGHKPAPAVPPVMVPPMMPPMYPGFPPMFSPLSPMGAPMPFFPMPNGMPMPYGMPPPPAAMAKSAIQKTASSEEKDAKTGTSPVSEKTKDEQDEQADKKPKPAPIKISPPEQFDQTRPYFFNGNVFYPGYGPMPMGGQPTPLTPSPYYGNFMHPAMARLGSFGQPSPMSPMTSPPGFPSPAFPPLTAGASNPAQHFADPAPKADNVPLIPGTKPPMTSIKPSEITKSQLGSLRSQLKYYEDQLQYNKHQIDERATHDQILTIRKLIAQFEHNFSMQSTFEKTFYPAIEKRGTPKEPAAVQADVPSTPGLTDAWHNGTSQVYSAKKNGRPFPPLSHTQSMDHMRQPKTAKQLRQRAGINSSKGADTSEALGALEAHLHRKANRSSLPTRAAMAPIFEPRDTTPSQEASDLSSIPDSSQLNGSQWNVSGMLPLGQSGVWPTLNDNSHSMSNGGLQAATENVTSAYASPYLVGKLPQGMGAQSFHGNEYVYSRELTEEEKRARHVYWGGVSTKGSGLPKFDGRDFYPASPVKEDVKIESPPKLKIGPIPTGRTDFDYVSNQPQRSDDPFRISRDSESILSKGSIRKHSHAVPIINPETGTREDINSTPRATGGAVPRSVTNSAEVRKSPQDDAQSSPMKTPTGSITERKAASINRRALERSSKGSNHDLWQNMMKKGSTSGSAVPGAISSTTATGYLPPSLGHAAASLTPTVGNLHSTLRATSGGKIEQDMNGHQAHSDKVGENRPPGNLPANHAEIIADLHQRMLRDAERRGVIGPGWQ